MVKYDTWMQVIVKGGKGLKPVIRNTEEGQRDYANHAYKIYGNNVITVEQYHFEYDGGVRIVLDRTWHA